jgi:hypothetical protein
MSAKVQSANLEGRKPGDTALQPMQVLPRFLESELESALQAARLDRLSERTRAKQADHGTLNTGRFSPSKRCIQQCDRDRHVR